MITSRVAVCCPKDRTLDDAAFNGERVCVAPGGRWLLDPLKKRLAAAGVSVPFSDPDPGQYWWLELRLDRVAFRFTLSHTFPFACIAHLYVRRSFLDHMLRRDHGETAEKVFKIIYEAMASDPRSGKVLTWRGKPVEKDAFIREASRKLGAPIGGVVRVDRDSGAEQGAEWWNER